MKSKYSINFITVLRGFLGTILFLYVCVYLILIVMQRQILFPTHIANASALKAPDYYHLSDFTEVPLTTSDGVRITGWEHKPAKDMPVILYLHGNGNNIGARADRYAAFANAGYGVFAVDYRGYGNSEGTPSEEGIYNDARAAINWLNQHYTSPRIILYGESLGSGVAVQMAEEYPVYGVVLQSAYTSVPDRAAEVYWFFPGIQYIVRDPFDSLSKISKLHEPILIIHGDHDNIIPIEHGRKLAAAATSRVRFILVPGAGHMDIPDPLILQAMHDFFSVTANHSNSNADIK